MDDVQKRVSGYWLGGWAREGNDRSQDVSEGGPESVWLRGWARECVVTYSPDVHGG